MLAFLHAFLTIKLKFVVIVWALLIQANVEYIISFADLTWRKIISLFLPFYIVVKHRRFLYVHCPFDIIDVIFRFKFLSIFLSGSHLYLINI